MDFKLYQSAWLGDWFVIDGCFAQPEGTADEWRQIIQAVKEGRNEHFKRIGVKMRNGYATFYSPRNSTGDGDDVLLSSNDLKEWIPAAEQTLKEYFQEVESGEGI